ncbi:SH3 domain-containing protein [Dokdonella sp.]|uniref:C40 family peptidase n=1 Tax=Dokdonella sp. TaxID=2291710 RepID=UPI0039C854E5
MNRTSKPLLICFSLILLGSVSCANALETRTSTIPAHGVIGVDEAQLSVGFWVKRLPDADHVILDPTAIAAQNAEVLHKDRSMHDLATLPEQVTRTRVLAWIDGVSSRPTRELFDIDGKPVAKAALDALMRNLDRDAVPELQAPRHGLIVHRAAMRSMPTALRVFSEAGNTDIDRFQESALFPGTPVLIVHRSRDKEWLFVVSARYAAWVEATAIAEGSAAEIASYAAHAAYRIVTGATVQTVFSREQPALSKLQLDMGVRLPLLEDWPPDKLVNGQHPYTSHVIELPLRKADGHLELVPALLQKNADTGSDYLPLTEANIIKQAFKFLGERYGWGHAYDARDCSGFVSEVYRSMGVLMPRNTRDQSVSPALRKRLFSKADDRATRLAAARAMLPGDLIYIPGHVMMVIGHMDGAPYVIHDTTGLSYHLADGSLRRITLNEVSVSPLLPLQFNDTETYVDRMTSIVTMRPAPTKDVRPVP